MKKYIVEEAIIVETIEKEPEFSIEVVQPEIIGTQKKRRRQSFFSSFFDDLIDAFFGEDELIDPEPEIIREASKPKPEIAQIVESDEAGIQEIRYFYAEIIK